MSITRRVLGSTLLLAAIAGTGFAAVAQTEQFPSRPIIFVATGTVGGGADVGARFAAEAIEKSGAINQPVAVLNRGTGVEAYAFTKGKTGDAHYALTVVNLFLTYPMIGQAGYNYTDFTPLANLVVTPIAVVVPADSPFKNLNDLIAAAKAKPNTITVGGGQFGTQDHLGYVKLKQVTGLDVRFVPFAGGGETHRNLLGKQVDVAMGDPSDFMSSIEAGKLRVLALLDDQRNPAPALKDVPTAKEQGIDATFVIWRGFVAPPKISEKDQAAMTDLFRKVIDDKGYQEKYIHRFGMRPAFMAGPEYAAFMKEREKEYRELLISAGLIKS